MIKSYVGARVIRAHNPGIPVLIVRQFYVRIAQLEARALA